MGKTVKEILKEKDQWFAYNAVVHKITTISVVDEDYVCIGTSVLKIDVEASDILILQDPETINHKLFLAKKNSREIICQEIVNGAIISQILFISRP